MGNFLTKLGTAASTLGGFAGPIGSLVGQGLNMGLNAIVNARNRKYERKMADYTYSKDLDMWNKANEYNSPKMQMQRFEEAGLNKNLIYERGSSGTAAQSMPKYQDIKGTFGSTAFDFSQLVDQYQNYALKKAQTDLVKEQIVNTKNLGSLNFYKADNEQQLSKYKWPGWHMFDLTTGEQLNDAKYHPGYMQTQADYYQASTKRANQQVLDLIQKTGISENQKKWLDQKLQTYYQTQVNIDKDSLVERIAAETFGDIFQFLQGKVKSAINPKNF